jgi:hypothetical protein
MLKRMLGISSAENCLRVLKNYSPCALVNFLSTRQMTHKSMYPKVAAGSYLHNL